MTDDLPFGRYRGGGRALITDLRIPKGSARHDYGPPIFAMCGYQCAYCGYDMAEPYRAWLNLSVDHVVPDYLVEQGHRADWVRNAANLVTCCRACNEFLNGYRVLDTPPSTEEGFFALRDRCFHDKRARALARHRAEEERYDKARATGPTEVQHEIEQPGPAGWSPE